MGFKLAAGFGELWCREGGIPQGCPLSMIFIVALYVPWCRRLEAMPAVGPQLFTECPRALFGAARFTVQHVRQLVKRCPWKVRPPQHFQGCQAEHEAVGCFR